MPGSQNAQLTAAWLNIIAAGIISGGVVTQLVALSNGGAPLRSFLLISICVVVGIALHVAAQHHSSRS